MKREQYTNANRMAWNEAAPIHKEINFGQLLKAFENEDFSCLDEIETAILKNIGVRNKSVAQLCCNNGRELLSIKRLGASRCVGFDISDKFIEQAKQLSEVCNIPCEFVCTDVYSIPSTFQRTFDVIFISVGALRWLPNIDEFFRVIATLLKENGWLILHEMHPILDMFKENDNRVPPPLVYSYFKTEPQIGTEGLDYYGKTTYKSSPMYEFHHKLSDILNSCIRNDFVIKSLDEYPNDLSSVYTDFENLDAKLPLSYVLTAHLEKSK